MRKLQALLEIKVKLFRMVGDVTAWGYAVYERHNYNNILVAVTKGKHKHRIHQKGASGVMKSVASDRSSLRKDR